MDSLKYLLEIEDENWLQTRYQPHQYSQEQHRSPGGKTQMINSPQIQKNNIEDVSYKCGCFIIDIIKFTITHQLKLLSSMVI